MLSATFKLCAGISYRHFRNMTGLRRMAAVALSHELEKLAVVGPGPSQWIRQTRRHSLLSSRLDDKPYTEVEMSYIKQGEEALKKSMSILGEQNGWKEERVMTNGDKVFSKVLPDIGKVYRLEAVLEKPLENVYGELVDNMEKTAEWNPDVNEVKLSAEQKKQAEEKQYTNLDEEQLLHAPFHFRAHSGWIFSAKILHKIGKDTMITYEKSAETLGKLIGTRDFVNVRCNKRRGSTCILAGMSTRFSGMPEREGNVRAENGPTCMILHPVPGDPSKTQITWMQSMDLKICLPGFLLNPILSRIQVDFAERLRNRVTTSPASLSLC